MKEPVLSPASHAAAAVFSRYPDTEERTPREMFTAKLLKICSKLDSKNAATLTDTHWFRRQPIEGTVEVLNLWVAGSYARGALTCGDLDLVAEIRTTGVAPRSTVMKRAFFGVHANVRIYWGTPADNTSGAVFKEAVRLWAPGHDWSTAVLVLPTDATAGRFPRRSDALPLRAEQHTLPLETVEELTEWLENGILKWRFIPLSELSRLPRQLSREDERLYRIFCDRSIRKKQLAPLAFALARQLADVNMGRAQLQLCSSEKALIRAGGVHVYAEQLTLRSDCLDSLGCCAVAVIPALSPRGPNGAWLIERGPNHPLVKAFSSVTAWALAERDGTVAGVQFAAAEDDGRQICVEGMELFASKEAAQDMENSFVCLDDQVGDDTDKLVPRLLSGAQILCLMGGLDVLMLSDGDELPLTQDGLRYRRALGEPGMEIVSADQVAKRLVHQTRHV